MIRRTLTILSLIGLLLSVGLWGASYLAFGYSIGTHQFIVRNGGVIWSRGEYGKNQPPFQGWHRVDTWRRWDTRWLPSRTVRWGRVNRYIPFWIPTAFFALTTSWFYLPLLRGRKHRKRKKLG